MSQMITVFADASLCVRTSAMGWGAWAKRYDWDRGKFFGGPGILVQSPNEAEVVALHNVLEQLQQIDALENMSAVMLQSDSLAALGALSTHIVGAQESYSGHAFDSDRLPIRRIVTDIERDHCERIAALIGARKLWLRHIKGHVGGTARGWVNNQCDREARMHMRKARDQQTMSRFLETNS